MVCVRYVLNVSPNNNIYLVLAGCNQANKETRSDIEQIGTNKRMKTWRQVISLTDFMWK